MTELTFDYIFVDDGDYDQGDDFYEDDYYGIESEILHDDSDYTGIEMETL